MGFATFFLPFISLIVALILMGASGANGNGLAVASGRTDRDVTVKSDQKARHARSPVADGVHGVLVPNRPGRCACHSTCA